MFSVGFPDFLFDKRLMLLFVALGFVQSIRQRKKNPRRRHKEDDLVAAAASYGWSLAKPAAVRKNLLFFKLPVLDTSAPVGDVDRDWLRSLDSQVFAGGRSYVSAVLSGTVDGVVFKALQYVNPGDKDTPTRFQAIVLVPLDRSGVKVDLRRELALNRLIDAAFDTDIDFQDEWVNKNYKVTSLDRKEAYGVVSQEIIEIVKEINPERLVWAPGCLIWAPGRLHAADVAAIMPHLLRIKRFTQ